jgi:hypothetical protein
MGAGVRFHLRVGARKRAVHSRLCHSWRAAHVHCVRLQIQLVANDAAIDRQSVVELSRVRVGLVSVPIHAAAASVASPLRHGLDQRRADPSASDKRRREQVLEVAEVLADGVGELGGAVIGSMEEHGVTPKQTPASSCDCANLAAAARFQVVVLASHGPRRSIVRSYASGRLLVARSAARADWSWTSGAAGEMGVRRGRPDERGGRRWVSGEMSSGRSCRSPIGCSRV